MAETKVLIGEKQIKYSGLIPVKGVYKHVKNFLDENGYDPFESRNEDEVYEDGKQIIIVLNGDKKLSDFAKIMWETKFVFEKLIETSFEKDGKTMHLHKGSLLLETSVVLATDYENSFEQTAFQYFLRVMIDKFVFKSYINRAADVAKKNYTRFEEKMKSYLNMESFK